MPRLFVLSGPELGRVFDLGEGAVLGRSSDCDAQLTHASISRHHARLERDEHGWAVVDVGSRNGVVFGGGRVRRAPLGDGAIFALGEVELRFRAEVEAVRDEIELDLAATTIVPRPDEPEAAGELVLEQPDEPMEPMDNGLRDARPPPPAPPDASPRPVAARVAPSVRARASAPPASVAPAATRGILQYQRVPEREGFFASDLAQQPGWVRFAVGVLVLAVFVGLTWGVLVGVRLLRERAQPESVDEAVPEAISEDSTR